MENNSSYKRARERIDQTDKMLRRLKIATIMFVVQAVFIVVVMVLIITAIVKVVL